MVNANDRLVELLNRRLALVADVSGLNARALKLNQALSGIEMDILRLEMQAGDDAGVDTARNLEERRGEAEAIRSVLRDCLEKIDETEKAMAEIDRQIAM